MPDEDQKQEIQQLFQENSPTPSKRKDLKSVIFFAVGLAVIWFIGSILTPIFPDEFIAMLLYAASFFFFGFDPTKWFKKN